MRKRVFEVILILFVFGLSINLANASISLSDVNDLYSLGDKIQIATTIIPDQVSGKFEINLFCDGTSINIERMSAEPRFVVSEEARYSTFIKLSPEYISNLKGKCNIQVSLGQDRVSTKSFIISDNILIKTEFDKQSYNPGDLITLNLEATKANGDLLTGFLEIDGLFQIKKQIKDGVIIEKFSIPGDIKSGIYNLNFKVYDAENDQVLNKGNVSVYFNINQVPKSIQMMMLNLEVIPGSNLTLNPELLDQSNEMTSGSILLILSSPKGKTIQKTVQSGESTSFYFPFDAEAGAWSIQASLLDIKEKRDFSVIKAQKVNFSIIDNVVIVKNIGNDIYNGNLDIKIGDEIKQISLTNLAIGSERKFSLNAPTGEYSIIVSDDQDKMEKGVVSLTGGAIGVNEFNGEGILIKNPFLWVLIILILLGAALTLLLKLKKTPFKLIGYLKDGSNKLYANKNKYKTIETNQGFSLKTKERVYEAEHSLVLKGEKQNSAVVVLKVHGYYGMNDNLKSQIKEIVLDAEKKKAAIETTNDSFIIIFNPQTTKTFANESIAGEFSSNLYTKMSELARKTKIKFGIGLNSGDIISGIDHGKLKYTSLGNTVLLARRLSEIADNKAYVSEAVRKKMLKAMKAEKVTMVNNTQIYEITSFSNSAQNNAKLDDLLKRIHQD